MKNICFTILVGPETGASRKEVDDRVFWLYHRK